VDYLTSDEALYLDEAPDSLVIMGGGYIAVEIEYFFEAMGTDVRVVEMMDSLIPREDTEVAEGFTETARERHDVYTGHRATSVERDGDGIAVRAETESGEETTVEGEELLVALGRRPNTDTLAVEEAGIETDENGFVKTNEYLEMSAENVWAQGDIADNYMFKHSGDYETEKMVANVVHGRQDSVDLSAMPHATFTEPQIAGVGATEDELRDSDTEYGVGKARYEDSAMGRAKKLEDGFVKVLVAPDSEILGCHMIGEEASVMIHQTVVAMRNGVTADEVADTIHAHPTLSRIVESAFEDAVSGT